MVLLTVGPHCAQHRQVKRNTCRKKDVSFQNVSRERQTARLFSTAQGLEGSITQTMGTRACQRLHHRSRRRGEFEDPGWRELEAMIAG